MNKYTHLNLHSEYSIQDGLIRINELANKAYELDFESLAITDLSNLFGFIKFYKELRKKGIKPICGSDFILLGENTSPGNLQLLAKNHNGYKTEKNLSYEVYCEKDIALKQGFSFLDAKLA